MSDILPCPFCGERQMHIEHADGVYFTHRCHGRSDRPVIKIVDQTEDRVRSAWNQRAALSQNTLHSSSVPSMLGVSTAMTTLAAEESVVPNSDPRPTSSPVSEQAGGEASPPVVSPSAAQFPE